MSTLVLELSDLSKNCGSLRPPRIERRWVGVAEHVALLGIGQMGAEIFVNPVTSATLPDRSEVKVSGRSTASIDDSADCLVLALAISMTIFLQLTIGSWV